MASSVDVVASVVVGRVVGESSHPPSPITRPGMQNRDVVVVAGSSLVADEPDVCSGCDVVAGRVVACVVVPSPQPPNRGGSPGMHAALVLVVDSGPLLVAGEESDDVASLLHSERISSAPHVMRDEGRALTSWSVRRKLLCSGRTPDWWSADWPTRCFSFCESRDRSGQARPSKKEADATHVCVAEAVELLVTGGACAEVLPVEVAADDAEVDEVDGRWLVPDELGGSEIALPDGDALLLDEGGGGEVLLDGSPAELLDAEAEEDGGWVLDLGGCEEDPDEDVDKGGADDEGGSVDDEGGRVDVEEALEGLCVAVVVAAGEVVSDEGELAVEDCCVDDRVDDGLEGARVVLCDA